MMIDSLLDGATAGADGYVSESGWSNSHIFYNYIKEHLIKFLPTRDDDDILLLYD
jgi:hypothetical protein